jgi:hypothetical protein
MSGRLVRLGGWVDGHRLLLWIIVAVLLFFLIAETNNPVTHYPGSD